MPERCSGLGKLGGSWLPLTPDLLPLTPEGNADAKRKLPISFAQHKPRVRVLGKAGKMAKVLEACGPGFGRGGTMPRLV